MLNDPERFSKAEIVKNPIRREEKVFLNPDDYEQDCDFLTEVGCMVIKRDFTWRERLVRPDLLPVVSRLGEFYDKAVALSRIIVKYPYARIAGSRDD